MLIGIFGLGFFESFWLGVIMLAAMLMYFAKQAASNPTVQKGAVEWFFWRLFK